MLNQGNTLEIHVDMMYNRYGKKSINNFLEVFFMIINSKRKNCKVINVISAKEMLSAVKQNLKFADIFIGASAVSDYRPIEKSKTKIKKTVIGKDTITLTLVKNPDILKYWYK